MPVHQADQRLILTHPDGPSAEVLLYGATVVSWKTGTLSDPAPAERLFVSSKAALDGSKPVRGGIPIVFPCFGAPSHAEHARLSQHGFARNQVWAFEGVVADDARGVSVRLTLDPTPSIEAVYERPFHLAYVVTVEEHALRTELHVTNTSTSGTHARDTLEFQALLHNYIRAPASEVLVFPLQNKTYYDKTETSEQGRHTGKTETRAGVDVRATTDSVYVDTGAAKYAVTWGGGGVEIAVAGLKDVVVWNPQREAGSKMADMEDGGWERYVCVEPGHVWGYARVEPGQTWTGGQVVTVASDGRTKRLDD